jgi:hypothetical protein
MISALCKQALVLLTNSRLGWKRFSGTNTLAYFVSLSVTEENRFITLTLGVNAIKLFSSSLKHLSSKQECLSLSSLSSLWLWSEPAPEGST